MLLIILGVIAVIELILVIMSFTQDRFGSGFAILFLFLISATFFGCGLSLTEPSVEKTKDLVSTYSELIVEYHEEKLNETEANQLALKIKEINEHIDFLNEHQNSLMYGIFIKDEIIEKIPMESWMEDAIRHSILWED